jgi:WD40 repeat protein
MTIENTGLVKCIAILNSNFRIVTGHGDGSINVWEPDTGKLLTTLLGHTGQVRYVVISPNDFRIVSASAHEIMIWDTFTYALLNTLREPQNVGISGLRCEFDYIACGFINTETNATLDNALLTVFDESKDIPFYFALIFFINAYMRNKIRVIHLKKSHRFCFSTVRIG